MPCGQVIAAASVSCCCKRDARQQHACSSSRPCPINPIEGYQPGILPTSKFRVRFVLSSAEFWVPSSCVSCECLSGRETIATRGGRLLTWSCRPTFCADKPFKSAAMASAADGRAPLPKGFKSIYEWKDHLGTGVNFNVIGIVAGSLPVEKTRGTGEY